MEKKRQHVIPRCYQKAWCDSLVPANHTPSISMVSKNGQQKKRKSPANAFVGADVYTVRLPDGKRELIIENTLERVESKFVHLVENKIQKGLALDQHDSADLCVFAAAMFSRVNSQSRNFLNFAEELHESVTHLERAHNVEPRMSLETAAMVENARPQFVAMSLQMLSELYYGMSMGIFVAPENCHFITSDSPTVWYNPEAYKLPPFWRSAGLAQEKVEVTVPLTPKFALYLSHYEKITGYLNVPARVVQDLNRRTRFHCEQWFISQNGEVREEWFEVIPLPEDRWENTPQGKLAAEQRAERETEC